MQISLQDFDLNCLCVCACVFHPQRRACLLDRSSSEWQQYQSHCRCVSMSSIDECEPAEGKCQITIFMNRLLIMTGLSILLMGKSFPPASRFKAGITLKLLSHACTHMKRQQCFLGDVQWEVRELRASVCSPACCFLRFSPSSPPPPPFHYAIHRLLPLFLFVIYFVYAKNISNIGKPYYKEGVAWMYVYMRNYVTIKKNDFSNVKKKKQR